ncbi:MAG: hypothetical protein OCD76_17960 [Reichenbachiella sp.]
MVSKNLNYTNIDEVLLYLPWFLVDLVVVHGFLVVVGVFWIAILWFLYGIGLFLDVLRAFLMAIHGFLVVIGAFWIAILWFLYGIGVFLDVLRAFLKAIHAFLVIVLRFLVVICAFWQCVWLRRGDGLFIAFTFLSNSFYLFVKI